MEFLLTFAFQGSGAIQPTISFRNYTTRSQHTVPVTRILLTKSTLRICLVLLEPGQNLQYRRVTLEMPLFEYESDFSLKEALATMGMPAAFSESADFSGMDGSRSLFITDVFHKAFVSVDEAGTEAAAATAVVVGLTAMPATPVEVTIDQPFIYLIRDIETGAILFIGRVMNPAA